ncbi:MULTISPECIES: hypothetical protein [unclassified Kitasatospora]|uniref:hypothetical protein n=1 Tax=unclassified Kitasatospora TaxID=2633591 RepID=UPI0033E67732
MTRHDFTDMEQLIGALQRLVDDFPMGSDKDGSLTVTVSGETGHPQVSVELRGEESAALAQAVDRMRFNFEQAHPDRAGICAHCHGGGRADESTDCTNCGERMRWWQSPDLPEDQAQRLGWWSCESCGHRLANRYDQEAAVELLPGHADGVNWRCVVCETTNPIDSRVCGSCERGRPQLVAGHRQYSITCPHCGSVDVEEFGEPIPTTHDDYADCARCRTCGQEWGLDPGADASCTQCGGSGRPGNGPLTKKDEAGQRVLTEPCVCTEEA